MIDIHSHFLPEIDDGPYDVSESLNILRKAFEDGIEEIVATPHSKMVWEKMSIDQLRDRFESYKSRVMNDGIDVKLHLGMDNRIEPGLEEKFHLQRRKQKFSRPKRQRRSTKEANVS